MAKVTYSVVTVTNSVKLNPGANTAVTSVLNVARPDMEGVVLVHTGAGVVVSKGGAAVSVIPWGNVDQAFCSEGTSLEDAEAALNDQRKAGK